MARPFFEGTLKKRMHPPKNNWKEFVEKTVISERGTHNTQNALVRTAHGVRSFVIREHLLIPAKRLSCESRLTSWAHRHEASACTLEWKARCLLEPWLTTPSGRALGSLIRLWQGHGNMYMVGDGKFCLHHFGCHGCGRLPAG